LPQALAGVLAVFPATRTQARTTAETWGKVSNSMNTRIYARLY
jgi:hypothetical protein